MKFNEQYSFKVYGMIYICLEFDLHVQDDHSIVPVAFQVKKLFFQRSLIFLLQFSLSDSSRHKLVWTAELIVMVTGLLLTVLNSYIGSVAFSDNGMSFVLSCSMIPLPLDVCFYLLPNFVVKLSMSISWYSRISKTNDTGDQSDEHPNEQDVFVVFILEHCFLLRSTNPN